MVQNRFLLILYYISTLVKNVHQRPVCDMWFSVKCLTTYFQNEVHIEEYFDEINIHMATFPFNFISWPFLYSQKVFNAEKNQLRFLNFDFKILKS